PSNQFVERTTELSTEMSCNTRRTNRNHDDDEQSTQRDETHRARRHISKTFCKFDRLAQFLFVRFDRLTLFVGHFERTNGVERGFTTACNALPRGVGGKERQHAACGASKQQGHHNGGHQGEKQEYGKEARPEWWARAFLARARGRDWGTRRRRIAECG